MDAHFRSKLALSLHAAEGTARRGADGPHGGKIIGLRAFDKLNFADGIVHKSRTRSASSRRGIGIRFAESTFGHRLTEWVAERCSSCPRPLQCSRVQQIAKARNFKPPNVKSRFHRRYGSAILCPTGTPFAGRLASPCNRAQLLESSAE
jgi:hypothetical protein